jgi:hypothetical protein
MRRIWVERHTRELAIKGIIVPPALDFMPKARAIYEREMASKK